MLYIRWVFKDKLSWVVFIATLILGMLGFKVFPTEGSTSLIHTLIGVVYSVLFAFIFTCLFKTLKEKLVQVFEHKKPLEFLGESKKHLKEGNYYSSIKSFVIGFLKLLVVILGVLGLGAAQFCVFGSPVCTFSVGAAIVTAIFPSFLVQILYEYAKLIIILAVVLQLVGLYLMGCFKRIEIPKGET